MPRKIAYFKPPHARAVGQRTHRQDRGSSSQRGYTWRWRNYSKAFLQLEENRWCVRCAAAGKDNLATETDHRVPVTGPEDPLFWEPTNHQGLCHDCHSRKTVNEDGGFGRKRIGRTYDGRATQVGQGKDLAIRAAHAPRVEGRAALASPGRERQ